MFARTRLKICCIASPAEAALAIAHGADALGLVAGMPSGPGPIADDLIRDIAASVPPPIATFLLTSEVDPDTVVDHVRRTRTTTVQLVDDSTGTDVYAALREAFPALRIVQVIHITGTASVDLALSRAPLIDALLLDSGNPTARELGGTGRTHNWMLSREVVRLAPRPVFLAGGLNSTNIAEAVRIVQPFGVDLCSSVRTSGTLDPRKLSEFARALHAANPSHDAPRN